MEIKFKDFKGQCQHLDIEDGVDVCGSIIETDAVSAMDDADYVNQNCECSENNCPFRASKSVEPAPSASTNTGSPKLLALCKRVVAHADTGVALPAGHPIIEEMREQLRAGA